MRHGIAPRGIRASAEARKRQRGAVSGEDDDRPKVTSAASAASAAGHGLVHRREGRLIRQTKEAHRSTVPDAGETAERRIIRQKQTLFNFCRPRREAKNALRAGRGAVVGIDVILLGPSPVSGVSGTALFHDSDGNGTLDPDADELIATLGTAAITAANTLDTAESPAPMDIARAGIGDIATSIGPDGSLQVTFTANASLPAGLILELETSRDLGAADPWHPVATRFGDGPWYGPARSTVAPPSGGKAEVTLSLPKPAGDLGRAFARFLLREG
ncbi:MAG: hypothetical protein R3F11_15295 [Verrucomicrobiales bacterium]